MNKKILIVDDERDIHELIKVHLQKMKGIEIVSAYSGEEAIEIYEKMLKRGEKPNLVIMDLNLSGKDEIEAICMHRDGKDRKLDGVRATRKIFNMDPKAIIWGYTAWFDTDWAERLKKLGVKKIFGRTTPFSEFAKMVISFLRE